VNTERRRNAEKRKAHHRGNRGATENAEFTEKRNQRTGVARPAGLRKAPALTISFSLM